MTTRKTTKPKRCLKFEGYIYLPDNNPEYNELRYHASRRAGRLTIYDEFGKPTNARAFAFDNLGQVIDKIESKIKKIMYKRVGRK